MIRVALLLSPFTLLVACSSTPTPAPSPSGATNDAAVVEDASIADAATADATVDLTASFGAPCTVGATDACPVGLFCLVGPSGGKTGFCTKTCPKGSSAICPGAPEGATAYCVVTDVNAARDKGCAFLCEVGGQTYTCPHQLKCATTQEPPGSGQRLCLP